MNRTAQPIPLSLPSVRVSAGLAYDSARRKMVLFGGLGGDFLPGSLGDTLEWDGVTGIWSDPMAVIAAPAREFHSMLYDPVRARVVMYGGFPLEPALWEWNGSRWDAAQTRTTPAMRQAAAMAYDSDRHKGLLFGGLVAGGFSDELWEWDGTAGSWTSLTPAVRPAVWPGGRSDHALAYDAARRKVVLFAGFIGGTRGQDLWEWDGVLGVWTNRTPAALPAAWPPAVAQHAMVYDAARSRMLVFAAASSVQPHLADVWEWNGNTGTWADRTPNPLPVGWPQPRSGVAAAYDSDRQRVVMVGGDVGANNLVRETWEWDGAAGTWTDRTVAARWPRSRASFGLVFDTARGKAVMYGGAVGAYPQNELWEWDGAAGTWTDRKPTILPRSWPAEDFGFGMVYDEGRRKVVVFDGVTQQRLVEWDGATGTWTDRTPTPLPAMWPSSRSGHAMAYDSRRRRVVVFGGFANPATAALGDTWEWNPEPNTWQLRAANGERPTLRDDHALAYDSRRGVVVLFGGRSADAGGTTLQDLWEWNGDAGVWINRTPAVIPAMWPPAREMHALAYSVARGRIVLFGGVGTLESSDTWEWDGATGAWQVSRAPAGSTAAWPDPRSRHAMTFDPVRQTVLLVSGQASLLLTPPRDVWEWGP